MRGWREWEVRAGSEDAVFWAAGEDVGLLAGGSPGGGQATQNQI